MSEKEHIVSQFQKNFIDAKLQLKDTVLYGLGKNSQIILDNFPNYPILGLLDGYKTEGEIYGKKILQLDQLKGENCRIIIVARAGSVNIIFHRIEKYCKKHHIEIYNLVGENLLEKNIHIAKEHPYFKVDKTQLEKEIYQHDNISFDIFDTLITRKVQYPEDVFEFIAKKVQAGNIQFKSKRILAEKKLSVNMFPNIYEIYEEIKISSDLSDDTIKKLIKCEIEMEKKLLIKRDAVVELLEYALSIKKRVFLISDMYLPKYIIVEILSNLGIKGYQDILVSCEFRTDKANQLFDIYKQKAGDGTFLHIGDSEEADGAYAQAHGIKSLLIKSPTEMMNLAMDCLDLDINLYHMNALQVGMFKSMFFNNPFCLFQFHGKLIIPNSYCFAYLLIAPIITEFIFWLIHQFKKVYFDKILFISRDGYLIKKLYDIAKNQLVKSEAELLPESIYFSASRTFCIASTIENAQDLQYAIDLSFDGQPEEFLRKRFKIEKDIMPYDNNIYQNISQYIFAHDKKIYEQSSKFKKNYTAYLKRIQWKQNQNVALFDFVSTGTCHMSIEKIVNQNIEGFYFAKVPEDYDPKKNLSINHFIGMPDEFNYVLYDNYFLFENIIKEPRASLSYINKQGCEVYCNEIRCKEQINDIKTVHQAIKDYFTYIIEIYTDEELLECGIGMQLLKIIDKKYIDIEQTALLTGEFRDEFSNRKLQLSI